LLIFLSFFIDCNKRSAKNFATLNPANCCSFCSWCCCWCCCSCCYC